MVNRFVAGHYWLLAFTYHCQQLRILLVCTGQTFGVLAQIFWFIRVPKPVNCIDKYHLYANPNKEGYNRTLGKRAKRVENRLIYEMKQSSVRQVENMYGTCASLGATSVNGWDLSGLWPIKCCPQNQTEGPKAHGFSRPIKIKIS